MVEIDVMSCHYCGAPLRKIEDCMWFCEYCGRYSLVSRSIIQNQQPQKADEDDDLPVSLSCEVKNEVRSFYFDRGVKLIFHYKKRATRADNFPATMSCSISDQEKLLLEDVPRFAYDIVEIHNIGKECSISFYHGKTSIKTMCYAFQSPIEINGIKFTLSE